MAGHLTRKELKSDQVALTLEQGFEYFQAHRQLIIRGGIALVALAALAFGIVYYLGQQHDVRDARLSDAMKVAGAPVGAAATPDSLSFPTVDAKAAEENKVFGKLMSDYSGSHEAYLAEYFLASADANQSAKIDEARKKFQDVADHADKNTASLAKLSLAQIAFQENKTADAESLLHDLMDHPTDMVSKEQATIELANGIKITRPADARKLLEPLVKEGGEIAGSAERILSELPKK